MCSGISSPGSATIPSGNSGKSRVRRSGMAGVYGAQVRSTPAGGRLGPPRGQQEVVEDRGGQHRLERELVETLQQEVAAERVLPPEHRHIVGMGGRLEATVEPTEQVRNELLTPHQDVA